MYAEWHKYDLAAPELEKAASLTPESAELQVTLGDAYLNLGQDQKALATFDHAVELNATPLVWNNIAYQLSLKGSHLDRAQQYAESAGLGDRRGVTQYLARSPYPERSALWFHRSSPTGTLSAGSSSAKEISTRPRNMWVPRGSSAITGKWETILARSTKSAERRTAPSVPMHSRWPDCARGSPETKERIEGLIKAGVKDPDGGVEPPKADTKAPKDSPTMVKLPDGRMVKLPPGTSAAELERMMAFGRPNKDAIDLQSQRTMDWGKPNRTAAPNSSCS